MLLNKGDKMNLIIIGPQGSGKGTQAGMISEKYNIPQIATGDIFREHLKKKTKLGKLAASYMNKGNLVPDDVVIKIVEDRLKKDDCKNGFILDGFPRNLNQAQALDKITKIELVFEIAVSEEVSIKRISGRRSCVCGATYHIHNIPPKKENICDKCGKELFQRDDDKAEAIKKRLAIYHEETQPVIDFYDEKGIVRKMDGEEPIETVFEDISKEIDKL